MQIAKRFANFVKTRDSFYGDNDALRVMVYWILLFCLDYSGVMDLYGQNFVRRLINMYRRTDELAYQKKLKPFCHPLPKMLTPEDIQKLQSIRIPDKTDVMWFSRKNTTTHQCCETYSPSEKQIIQEISEKIRQKYEREIGKKLYYFDTNKATIYVYHGKNSQHLWHVDPRNRSEIYNVVACFKKKGEISPLQCKNKSGLVDSLYLEEGDAALFNGGTTVHQVPPNEDDQSERTVLSISFISDKSLLGDDKHMVTYIQGGNNYVNILKMVLAIFCINLVIGGLTGVNHIPYATLVPFMLLVFVIVKYVPLYVDIGLGSGRASSFTHNIISLFVVMLASLSVKGAILFGSYFMLSDVFFARSWVEYD